MAVKRSHPREKKPSKEKVNIRLFPVDVVFIHEELARRRKMDPYGASVGQIIHDALAQLADANGYAEPAEHAHRLIKKKPAGRALVRAAARPNAG